MRGMLNRFYGGGEGLARLRYLFECRSRCVLADVVGEEIGEEMCVLQIITGERTTKSREVGNPALTRPQGGAPQGLAR